MLPGSRNEAPRSKLRGILAKANKAFGDEGPLLASRRSNLWLRARVIQATRAFFIDRGYLEIETPYLIPAPTPESHIDPIETELGFLHTSPELCMKRLLAAGYPKIFQICKCFRKGERGELHLPEFTLLEWYRAGIDYRAIMEECERMIRHLALHLTNEERIDHAGARISLERPWDWVSVREAYEWYGPCTMEEAVHKGIFDEIMVKDIEPHLGRGKPTFLYDYPAQYAALARIKEDDPSLAERVELYIGGLEVANAFTELTDAEEQRRRFQEECLHRKKRGRPIYPLPEKFLSALPSMPPSAGIALGVDRLVMIFANASEINEVVTFAPEEL